VTDVFPIYQERVASLWKDSEHRGVTDSQKANKSNTHPIRVIAFNPSTPVLSNKPVEMQQEKLFFPNTVLFDRKSKDEYGFSETEACKNDGTEPAYELGGRAVRVVGCFDLGTDFTSDGTVLMSDQTFARLFPNRAAPAATLQMADVGIVQIAKD